MPTAIWLLHGCEAALERRTVRDSLMLRLYRMPGSAKPGDQSQRQTGLAGRRLGASQRLARTCPLWGATWRLEPIFATRTRSL
jgi:hypothetical protein